MSRHEGTEIEPGAVFEFYESKEILCGVVLSVKDGRFNALSERNREVSLTLSRMVCHGKTSLDLKLGRDELLKKLASISEIRRDIMGRIDLEQIWSLLESEEAGYDAEEITEFIFTTPISDDQAAAVKRLLLSDRLYFQVKDSVFFARSAENVAARRIELEKKKPKGSAGLPRGQVGRGYSRAKAKCSPDRIPRRTDTGTQRLCSFRTGSEGKRLRQRTSQAGLYSSDSPVRLPNSCAAGPLARRRKPPAARARHFLGVPARRPGNRLKRS